jgi:hypothetical protein
MDTIEYVDPVDIPCQCCGARMTRLTRFVSREGAPSAIYRALLPFGTHERQADVVISLGDWAGNASSSDCVSFAIHLTADQKNFNVSFVEPDQTSWASDVLGRLLSRAEALQHPWKRQVLAISNQMVEADEPIVAYLSVS